MCFWHVVQFTLWNLIFLAAKQIGAMLRMGDDQWLFMADHQQHDFSECLYWVYDYEYADWLRRSWCCSWVAPHSSSAGRAPSAADRCGFCDSDHQSKRCTIDRTLHSRCHLRALSVLPCRQRHHMPGCCSLPRSSQCEHWQTQLKREMDRYNTWFRPQRESTQKSCRVDTAFIRCLICRLTHISIPSSIIYTHPSIRWQIFKSRHLHPQCSGTQLLSKIDSLLACVIDSPAWSLEIFVWC